MGHLQIIIRGTQVRQHCTNWIRQCTGVHGTLLLTYSSEVPEDLHGWKIELNVGQLVFNWAEVAEQENHCLKDYILKPKWEYYHYLFCDFCNIMICKQMKPHDNYPKCDVSHVWPQLRYIYEIHISGILPYGLHMPVLRKMLLLSSSLILSLRIAIDWSL